MPAVTKREPALTVASLQAVLGAVLVLIVAAGVDISETLQAAIIGVYVATAPIVFGFFTRSKVTPVP